MSDRDNSQQATPGEDATTQSGSFSRRTLLRGVGAGALALGAAPLLEACSSGLKGGSSGGSGKRITIGFVTPLTGAVAGFATSDSYVISQIRNTSQFSKGIKAGSKTYPVDIVVKDSQSDPNRQQRDQLAADESPGNAHRALEFEQQLPGLVLRGRQQRQNCHEPVPCAAVAPGKARSSQFRAIRCSRTSSDSSRSNTAAATGTGIPPLGVVPLSCGS